MNNPAPPAKSVQIEQRHREAACRLRPDIAHRIMDGDEDQLPIVQAFAAFERSLPVTEAGLREAVEAALRKHCDVHGPSGGAWNISSILDIVRSALPQQPLPVDDVEPAPPACLAVPNDDDRRTAQAVLISLNPTKPDHVLAATLIAAYRVAVVEAALRTDPPSAQ